MVRAAYQKCKSSKLDLTLLRQTTTARMGNDSSRSGRSRFDRSLRRPQEHRNTRQKNSVWKKFSLAKRQPG